MRALTSEQQAEMIRVMAEQMHDRPPEEFKWIVCELFIACVEQTDALVQIRKIAEREGRQDVVALCDAVIRPVFMD